MLGILHVLAVAVAGLFSLIVPAVLFAIADGMRDLALSMLLVGSLGVFAALMVLGSIAGFQRQLGRASGYVALVAMWVLVPVIAAVSFKTLTGLSWIDAWFEIGFCDHHLWSHTFVARNRTAGHFVLACLDRVVWRFPDVAVDHPCPGARRVWRVAGR